MLQSLMQYFWEYAEQKIAFVYSDDFAQWCKQQDETPWPYYKGKGVNPWNIAHLLKNYVSHRKKRPKVRRVTICGI